MASLDVATLRELLRYTQDWRVLREDEGLDVITDPDGTAWCLDDIEYLIADGLPKLPPRQRLAIELCLIQGIRERDAAIMMGVAPTNPVCSYATDGLRNLLVIIHDGRLPRFQAEKTAA